MKRIILGFFVVKNEIVRLVMETIKTFGHCTLIS